MSERNGDTFEETSEYKRITVTGRDGAAVKYVVREAGPEYWPWYERMAETQVKFGGDGHVKAVAEAARLQDDLIALCVTTEDGVPVDPTRLRWGVKLRLKVFELCQAACGMTRESGDAEGKDSGGGGPPTGGSSSPASSAAP